MSPAPLMRGSGCRACSSGYRLVFFVFKSRCHVIPKVFHSNPTFSFFQIALQQTRDFSFTAPLPVPSSHSNNSLLNHSPIPDPDPQLTTSWPALIPQATASPQTQLQPTNPGHTVTHPGATPSSRSLSPLPPLHNVALTRPLSALSSYSWASNIFSTHSTSPDPITYHLLPSSTSSSSSSTPMPQPTTRARIIRPQCSTPNCICTCHYHSPPLLKRSFSAP